MANRALQTVIKSVARLREECVGRARLSAARRREAGADDPAFARTPLPCSSGLTGCALHSPRRPPSPLPPPPPPREASDASWFVLPEEGDDDPNWLCFAVEIEGPVRGSRG